MARLHTIDCHSKASFLLTGTAVRRGVADLVDSENKGLTRKNREKQALNIDRRARRLVHFHRQARRFGSFD